MNKYIFIACLFILKGISSIAQTKSSFFDKKEMMTIGSYYYPEQWPKKDWERDIKKMSELGFEFTHFGEFAWATMEPEEGKYDFTWLDEAIELAHKNNLKVILCTPTPTPPAWLTHKHPEILMKNAEGRRIQHGARQQASWSSDVYRSYVKKIVEILAQRYGNNKAVWGWQIDNEPSHYGAGFDYSDSAQKSFRVWLKNKYLNIDSLNKTWGNAFWSQTYNYFVQINIPNQKELIQQANPHAILDFKRFNADEVADFVLFQDKILKKYINKTQWVTTNLMADHSAVDPLRFKDLDFVTYTKYLVAGFDNGHGDQGFRMGSSGSIGFANDFFRNINGITGVMELQPGQVNWGSFNPQTLPGVVRMWLYHVFAGDNKLVCNYRFRQPLSGGEQYHYGIMKPNGTEVSTSGEEYIKVSKELKELRKQFDIKAKKPKSYIARSAAILYNPDNRWETQYQPQTFQWDFMSHMMRYYGALQQLGAPIDVIDETHDFSKYPVLIAPAYQLLDKQLIERWKNYVNNGGHLILSSRTGQKNREAHLWESRLQEPIYNLIGAEEIFYDHLPESKQGIIEYGEQKLNWNNWADVISPSKESTTWAIYKDQFYKGKASVIHRKLGKGSVTYIGADTDDGELERQVVEKVYKEAKIETLNLEKGIVVNWRDGFWIALNYSSEEQFISLPKNAKILIGQTTLKPADVLVWKD